MGDNKVDNKGFYDDFEAKNIDKDYLDEMYRKAHTRSFTIDEFLEYQRKLNEPEPEFDMKRLGRIVALLAIVIISSIGFTIYTVNQGANADKNKENKMIVNHTENDRSVVSRDASSGENAVPEKIVIKNWEDVMDQSEKYPELIIPKDLPTDYSFKSFEIQTYEENKKLFFFRFESEDRGELLIRQYESFTEENPVSAISNETKIVKVESVVVEITKADLEKNAIAVLENDNNRIIISGEISEKEIISLVKGIIS